MGCISKFVCILVTSSLLLLVLGLLFSIMFLHCKRLEPADLCRYNVPMRYAIKEHYNDMLFKNEAFAETFYNQSLERATPIVMNDIGWLTLFKMACISTKLFPRQVCNVSAWVHEQCENDISNIHVESIKQWMEQTQRLFAGSKVGSTLVLPVNFALINDFPEPFQTYAFAGALSAELLLCGEDRSWEMTAFRTLQERMDFPNGTSASSDFWYPGTAEQLYWTMRLQAWCIKSRQDPSEFGELRYFERLNRYIEYLKYISV